MGDSHTWPDNFAWKPHAWLSPLLKLNRQMIAYAEHKASKHWGTQAVHRHLFGRCNILPMCSFLWETTIHGRTPVHRTPKCRCPSPPFRNTMNRRKHMVNNPRGMLPTHLHAYERRDKLPMCGLSWGTAMHGQPCIHGTPMYNCPPYWHAINRR